MAFVDTHLIVKELMNAGTSEEEAEVLVKRFVAKDEIDYLKNELATKADIYRVEADISEIKTEISELKTNIHWIKSISIGTFLMLLGSVVAILFKRF